jgi:hypothetical protein
VPLSHRGSAEVWHRSMDVTVLARTRDMLAMDDDADPMVPLFRAMFDDVFVDLDDPAEVMEGYERRLAQVRTEIGPEHLVEWQPADGWEPICRALGVPVPDRPFPHENTTADFLLRAEARALES